MSVEMDNRIEIAPDAPAKRQRAPKATPAANPALKATTAATKKAEPTPTLPPPAPPAPPTECRECYATLTWRDAAYVAEPGLCKRCRRREVNERLTHGRQVKASGHGANRAQRRAQGQRNPVMRLEIVRATPSRQSSGRRSHKRHHVVACLCCDTPPRATRREGAA